MTGPTQDDLQTRLAAALLVYLESQKPEPAPDERRAEIRRWYAGQALQGYLAAHSGVDVRMPAPEFAVMEAFAYADAMLKAEGL